MKIKGILCGLLGICLLSGCSRQPARTPASEAGGAIATMSQTAETTGPAPFCTTMQTLQTAPTSTERTVTVDKTPSKAPTKAPTKAPAQVSEKVPTKATTQAPTKAPESRSYAIGETWVVENQWSLTFTKVTRHTFCNRFDDGAGYKDCLILTYDYSNLGYTGSIQDLFFSSVSFDVYDATGEATETYPCTHTANPKVCSVGTKCTGAQQAYKLKNTGDTITVHVEYYTSDHKREKAVFKLKITDGGSSSELPSDFPLDVITYQGFPYAPDFGAMLNIAPYQTGEVTIRDSLKSQSMAYSISSMQGVDGVDTCVEDYDRLLRRCGYIHSDTTSSDDMIYMNRQYGASVMMGIDDATRMFIVTVAGPAD